ncbi:MAG: hypothetical protein ISS48_02515 [Candidatus Aenigmarchaeota archaeon]|nr:hypothetical protein [Candidatus Aenigmarchaeota archaeon]
MVELTLKDMQKKAKEWNKKIGLDWPKLIHYTHLVEEVGELGEALAASEGARMPGKGEVGLADHSDVREEIGDTLFSLAAIANECGVDLEDAFNYTLNRYKEKQEKFLQLQKK